MSKIYYFVVKYFSVLLLFGVKTIILQPIKKRN